MLLWVSCNCKGDSLIFCQNLQWKKYNCWSGAKNTVGAALSPSFLVLFLESWGSKKTFTLAKDAITLPDIAIKWFSLKWYLITKIHFHLLEVEK